MGPKMKAYLEKNLETMRIDLSLDALSVFSRNENQRMLFLEAWTGDKPRDKCPFGVTPLGQCGETGEAYTLQKKHVRPKYQSELVVPIHQDELQLGVLQCASIQANFFGADIVPKVKAIVNLLGKNWQA